MIITAETPPGAPLAAESEKAAVAATVTPTTTSSAKSEEDEELARLRKERERVAAENALASEKLRQELFTLESEKQRLQLENSLRSERLNAEMAEFRTKLDRLALETEAINKQIALDSAQRREQMEQELAALRSEEERMRLNTSIANGRIESRLAEMRMQEAEQKVRRAELEMEVVRLQTELTRREKTDVLRDLAPPQVDYPKEPFVDGQLLVSDRRIALNGVIVLPVADYIAERIDYYNNQNADVPIFIVIDASPGGSLLAGEKILKAMAGSKAPIYVVVKSYAASMAAVIVAYAERSFAYPNAILLHHQPSWLGIGNLTQQREQLQWSEEWWRRMVSPVAAKMGISLDEMIKRMYQKNSDGDWKEFADAAVKLKWVGHVVDRVWDTSLDKNPDRFGSRPMMSMQLEEKVDEQGRPFMVLPRLAPFDNYFLHNPDQYFRLR